MAHFTRTPVAERKITFDEILKKYGYNFENVEDGDDFTDELIEAAGLTGTPLAQPAKQIVGEAFLFSGSFADDFEAFRCIAHILGELERLESETE